MPIDGPGTDCAWADSGKKSGARQMAKRAQFFLWHTIGAGFMMCFPCRWAEQMRGRPDAQRPMMHIIAPRFVNFAEREVTPGRANSLQCEARPAKPVKSVQ